MIGNSIIMELIANGTLWYYESYDHNAAIEDLKLQFPSLNIRKDEGVPIELKQKYLLWRIGKLRTMTFDPDGMAQKMYIGRSFKYTKCFFPHEVGGSRVKPIININQDKYNLIKAGIAVDESSLNL